jgi:hypothetical protein
MLHAVIGHDVAYGNVTFPSFIVILELDATVTHVLMAPRALTNDGEYLFAVKALETKVVCTQLRARNHVHVYCLYTNNNLAFILIALTH